MKVLIHTAPNCVQCTMTKKALQRLGIEAQEVEADPKLHEIYFGSRQLPGCVELNSDGTAKRTWVGFRPDIIREL